MSARSKAVTKSRRKAISAGAVQISVVIRDPKAVEVLKAHREMGCSLVGIIEVALKNLPPR